MAVSHESLGISYFFTFVFEEEQMKLAFKTYSVLKILHMWYDLILKTILWGNIIFPFTNEETETQRGRMLTQVYALDWTQTYVSPPKSTYSNTAGHPRMGGMRKSRPPSQACSVQD